MCDGEAAAAYDGDSTCAVGDLCCTVDSMHDESICTLSPLIDVLGVRKVVLSLPVPEELLSAIMLDNVLEGHH